MSDNSIQIVLKFEELINGRNAEAIAAFYDSRRRIPRLTRQQHSR
jgi:hypothetical protein